MSESRREELIKEIVNKHGSEAEAPAREVAQVYEDEFRNLESQYEDLEQTAVNQNRRAAGSIKSLSVTYLILGLGIGIMAATFAINDLLIAEFVLYLIGAVMSGISLLTASI